MTRKIIQIAANSEHLYALCDEGEIFQLTGNNWTKVNAIPQTTSPPTTEAMAAQIRDLAIALDLSPAERAALEAKLLGS